MTVNACIQLYITCNEAYLNYFNLSYQNIFQAAAVLLNCYDCTREICLNVISLLEAFNLVILNL